MTIARALVMLEGCKADMKQAAVENVGNVYAMYDGALQKVSRPIVESYNLVGFEEFWKTYGSSGVDLMMKFEAGIGGAAGKKREGRPPDGGEWETWDKKTPLERMRSLDRDFIYDWVSQYKDLTFADGGLIDGTSLFEYTPLARHIMAIITGGNTHAGRPDLFMGTHTDTGLNQKGLAAVAGIYDNESSGSGATTKMLLEVLLAWVNFMFDDPQGVVKRVTTSLQHKTALRVVQN